MASAKVLHERVTAHDHASRTVAFESPHRSQSRFEPAVVALDAVVRVPRHVVKRAGHELVDDGQHSGRTIGDDLNWLAMRAQRRGEEPSRRADTRLAET